MKGYILTCPEKPAEFKRYEDYYRHLMRNVLEGIDVNSSLDELFAITYPIAYKRMREWHNVETDIDQLTPLVSIAFMKSVKTYNPYREDASFMRLYELFIKREMIDEYFCTVNKERVLKPKYRNTELRLDKVMDSDDTGQESYANVIPDRGGSQADVITVLDCIKEGVDHVFTQVEEEGVRRDRDLKSDREIFEIMLNSKIQGEHLSQKELSKKVGMTQSMVCRIWNRYIHRLEKYVMEEC